jgi:hypothetical protein
MPIYTFHNNKTNKIFTEMMSIAEMEEYLKKNPHIKQQITQMNIVGGVSGLSYRSDGGWKDNLSRIAEAHPNSPLAQQHGKRSIKQVKTEQAIKKYKARRSAKNK